MGDRLRNLLGKPSISNMDQRSPSPLLFDTDEATSSSMAGWASKTSLAGFESHAHQPPKHSPGQPKVPYRGSALWQLGRGSAASLPDAPPTTPCLETVLEFKRRNPGPNPEAPKPQKFDPIAELWHNPTLVQMGEALHAAMMSARDPLAPIPKELVFPPLRRHPQYLPLPASVALSLSMRTHIGFKTPSN
jgi:hypothetical protein